MKLLEEVPKIGNCLKCLKFMNSADFNKLKSMIWRYFNFPVSGFPDDKHRSLIEMTERSDTTILGNLGICYLCLCFQTASNKPRPSSVNHNSLQSQFRTVWFTEKAVGTKNQDQ